MTRLFSVGLALISVLLMPGSAFAQADQPQAPAPAHLAFVDGAAWLERQGRADPAPANMPLIAGDRLRTERGRVEVVFGDGSALHLDQFTTVDFQSDALLRLLAGRVRLIVAGLDPDDPDERVTYRIDTPAGAAEIQTVGDYRVSLVGAPAATDVELAVLRGSANLVTEVGSIQVTAGVRSLARAGEAPSYPVAFNSARWDAFDRWSEDRLAERLGVASTAYLPSTLRPYASTFDRHGYWQRHSTYGDVWYPRVSSGWRPYYQGQWNFVGSFGWTWIGYDPWAWPTHHYGRWGFSTGSWFWIPGVHWGPAWVSWAWTPAYVAWCPLGFDGWPIVNINAFYSATYYGRGPHHPWHGWNVAHANAFNAGHVSVGADGVAVERLDGRTRASFASRTDPPAPRGLAVPRPIAPIRSVGNRAGYAVPRSTGGVQAAPRSAATAGAGPLRPAPSGAVASSGRRAIIRSPSATRGLGAPPRESSGSVQPSLGDLSRMRSRTSEQPRTPTGSLVVPRRAPLEARPSLADPGVARERIRTPGGLTSRAAGPVAAPRRDPAPRVGSLPPSPDRTPTRTREYAPPPMSRRAPDPGSVGPGDGGRAPAPRERSSSPRGGGVERSAPPRAPGGSSPSPRGLSPGPAPGAPRGGQSGSAVRRPPG